MQHGQSHKSLPPVLAASVLNALEPVSEAASIRQELALSLQKTVTKDWILSQDLLIVFCVLDALQRYDQTFVPGSYLAYALHRLIKSEIAPGGPYVSKVDPDPVANIFIARFLSQHDVNLPNLQKYLEDLVAKKEYPKEIISDEGFRYLLAPTVSPSGKLQLLEELQKTDLSSTPVSAQQAALQITSIYRFGNTYKLCDLVESLMQAILLTSTWKAEPLFTAKLQAEPSQILTTAIILEALSLQLAATKIDVTVANDELQAHQAVLRFTKKQLSMLPPPLNSAGLTMWEQMRQADRNHEIILIPRFFADSLKQSPGLSEECLQLLGAANFYCWISTIIYDDFIDEEGKPELLPLANVAHRLSLDTYRQAIPSHPEIYDYIGTMYTAVDRANAWEVANTRAAIKKGTIQLAALPYYGNRTVLADRAFGHAIGSVAIVIEATSATKKQRYKIERALQHYLIARQLNDDLHDWRKDLQVGQLSTVVTDLLRGANIEPGSYELAQLIPRLETYFFNHGLQKICSQLIGHIVKCRAALKSSRLMAETGGFITLINDLEVSALEAVEIQANEQAFLRSYQQAQTELRHSTV